MANIGDLTDTIKTIVPKITGLNMKNGVVGYTLAEGDSLTQGEIDLFDAQVVIWLAQTEAEQATSEALALAKAQWIVLRDAEDDFNTGYVADLSAMTSAQVRAYVDDVVNPFCHVLAQGNRLSKLLKFIAFTDLEAP